MDRHPGGWHVCVQRCVWTECWSWSLTDAHGDQWESGSALTLAAARAAGENARDGMLADEAARAA